MQLKVLQPYDKWIVSNVITSSYESGIDNSDTMPLAQEKPRFEYAFTNNNDHNYLHKKFKKMASTISLSDIHSARANQNIHKDTDVLQNWTQPSISNGSISAAHPEIEKIKSNEVDAQGDTQFDNVQINYNETCNRIEDVNNSDRQSGETRLSDEIFNKTENFENDVPRDIVNGGTSGRYVCPYCKLSCAKPSVLQKHIRAHTNERPYPCGPCGFAFKTKSNLYKHCKSRTHALRTQGGDGGSSVIDEDWSGESESDASLPATASSDTCSEGIFFRQENSRPSELSSPELIIERITPPTSTCLSTSSDTTKSKTIYKPKFRASFYQDEEEKRKHFSPNSDFLNEHISKIISDNEAIVDVIETPLQKKYGKKKLIAENRQMQLNDTTAETKNDLRPLNLTKTNNEQDHLFRKRCYSESFSPPDNPKHTLNPEGSIIKDLLLKTKASGSGFLPVNKEAHEGIETLYVCSFCQIPYKCAEYLETHRKYYCTGNNGIVVSTSTSKGTKLNHSNVLVRSNSVNVTSREIQANSLSKLANNSLKSPPLRNNKPDNLVIMRHETNDVAAPLPSPGPLLGNTRLVDSRVSLDYTRNRASNLHLKMTSSPKRRLDSRSDVYSPRLNDDIIQRTDNYTQTKMRCLETNPTTLRSLEELSHSPMRPNSTSLQMFGGEVKIMDHSGSTTTLRIEPSKTQLSPIMVQQILSPTKHVAETESSSVVVRSTLQSGGTMVHNPPTPREATCSPHHQTPRILLSIATSLTTPTLSVNRLPTPNITHFQFPPLGAISGFNPLTLPPLSPSLSPSGATTILHGGKLIPHVPGIPGPNTSTLFTAGSNFQNKFATSKEPLRVHSLSPRAEEPEFRMSVNVQKSKAPITSNSKTTNVYQNMRNQVIQVLNNEVETITSSTNQMQYVPLNTLPRIKITDESASVSSAKVMGNITQVYSRTDSPVKRNFESIGKISVLKETANYDSKKKKIIEKLYVEKAPEQEIRNFNFENFITKSEIYNNQIPSSSEVQKNTNAQDTVSSPSTSFDRSETSYFKKVNPKSIKDDNRPKFLRPSTLPLKPGTFTPKKHHGITPNANTMPLVSPETPRPAKAYGQLYLNGNAYTYLGLKCSTKVFYCTLTRPQPTYVPNQQFLSMYCNWQLLAELNPHPLGFPATNAMTFYDSRHRPQNSTVANISHDYILTHSSQWKKHFKEIKQKMSPADLFKAEEAKLLSPDSSIATKNKELAGGFESNEEYTYVRGRGRGRYVCLECGIRCKKPSMLKKHIRTHTDVRPYTCKHCAFSFKTKGNLTKHMKSKAHYKKCCELGINPSEGTDGEIGEMNQGSGETDDESDSDIDDGNEGETESSDTDSYKSRLPEHEAAHCLLSLWGTRPSTTSAPGLITSARPSTYPYLPTGSEVPSLEICIQPKPDINPNTSTESSMEIDNEPMDLSKAEVKSSSALVEISTAREYSVLASLASNAAKLPMRHSQWTNGEPMLHAYLTERALQDTKIKQSQLIGHLSKVRRHDSSKSLHQESNNIITVSYSSFGVQDSILRSTAPSQNFDLCVTTSNQIKLSSEISEFRPKTVSVIKEDILPVTTASTVLNSPIASVDSQKSQMLPDASSNTDNAKFVASEYLKMARSKNLFDQAASSKHITSEDNKMMRCNPEDLEKSEKSEKQESDIRKMHIDYDPVARKVVIGAGGVAFKVASKSKDYQASSAYAPGRLTEDGRSVCVVCNKTFSKPSQLRLHINIHYMERPFRCSACAVSFRTRGHLQKHERSGSHHNKVSMTSTFGAATSLNPRPFRCSDCNIAFRIHGHLAKHLRSKMHVMRLECLFKLPFGTFTEIERAGVSLTDIDTTDCASSLASLQLLAQKLHEKDPTKLESWDPTTMVPPLLPAGRESSDDEDGGLSIDNRLCENSEKDNEIRTNMNSESPCNETRIIYSATDI